MPYSLIHRRDLIVTDDVAAFHIVPFFRALVGAMVNEHNAISRFGVKDDVLLRFAPRLKLGAVYGI